MRCACSHYRRREFGVSAHANGYDVHINRDINGFTAFRDGFGAHVQIHTIVLRFRPTHVIRANAWYSGCCKAGDKEDVASEGTQAVMDWALVWALPVKRLWEGQ